jgi:glutaconyl-CoA decarboxylase
MGPVLGSTHFFNLGGGVNMKKFRVVVNGESYEVEVEELGSTPPLAVQANPVMSAPPAAAQAPVISQPPIPAQIKVAVVQENPEKPKPLAIHGAGVVTAPMPGNIYDVKVAVGDKVNPGDALLILEAMKMENEITAPVAGTVKEVHVQQGHKVQTDDILVVIG